MARCASMAAGHTGSTPSTQHKSLALASPCPQHGHACGRLCPAGPAHTQYRASSQGQRLELWPLQTELRILIAPLPPSSSDTCPCPQRIRLLQRDVMLEPRDPCIPGATQLQVHRPTPGIVPFDGGVFHGTALRASRTPLHEARSEK